MKYRIFLTTQFKKDVKRLSEKDRQVAVSIINRLAAGENWSQNIKTIP